ncbi:MAG: hypothetical protein RLZZ01_1868 [Actinomycetota bacterium]
MDPADCDLCAAAPITTWWWDDETCWVAECESCGVPMVVWKVHDPEPPPAVKAELLDRLRTVADVHGPEDYWIDDRLRSVPDHYHAHARRRWWR